MYYFQQSLVGTRERIEDLPTIEEVLTIIGGLHKTWNSRHAHERYAKEARYPPQALVCEWDMHPIRSTWQKPEDIFFMETNAKWIHHPYSDALVIMVKMANSIVHRMLVDNDSATDILY